MRPGQRVCVVRRQLKEYGVHSNEERKVLDLVQHLTHTKNKCA